MSVPRLCLVTAVRAEGEMFGTYPVGAAPAKRAFLDSDGESIWVTDTSDDTVSKLTPPQ